VRIFTAETAVLQRKSPRWALQRTLTGLENASTSLTVRPLLTALSTTRRAALSLSKGHQAWLPAGGAPGKKGLGIRG